jgi:hypothetical protein
MLQPFEIFSGRYLQKLLELNRRWIVTQSYARGIDPFAEHKKTPVLLTDYDDIATAKTHWNSVSHDRYGAIIDLEKPMHLGKLREMMAEDSPYILFWAVVRSVEELEERINSKYKDHMRRYIENRTHWKPGGDQSMSPSIQVIFGEIFIILKYQKEVLKVKFEEIEHS